MARFNRIACPSPNLLTSSKGVSPAWPQDRAVADEVGVVEAAMGADGRVLLRPSGTEPLIRVMIEGQSGHQVELLTRQLADVVEQLST